MARALVGSVRVADAIVPPRTSASAVRARDSAALRCGFHAAIFEADPSAGGLCFVKSILKYNSQC